MIYSLNLRCQTKQRPRVTRRGTFMPKAYVSWKQRFRDELLAAYGRPEVLESELVVAITASFKHKARGDVDNYAGAVLDACNGLLYKDDRQVKRLYTEVIEQCGKDKIELTVLPLRKDLFRWRPTDG